MIRGLAGQLRPRREDMIRFQITPIENVIQRTHGQGGGKRKNPLARRRETGRLHDTFAERSPHIVVIAANE